MRLRLCSLLHASSTNHGIHEERKLVTRPRSVVPQAPSLTSFARNGHPKALCPRTTDPTGCGAEKSPVPVPFVNVRGSVSQTDRSAFVSLL
jgi:hypothetical protein